jgi:hypothetical protein
MFSRWERLSERPGREAGLRYSAGRAQRGCGRSVRWNLAITIGKASAHGRDRGTAGLQGGSPEATAILLVRTDFLTGRFADVETSMEDLLPIAVHSVDCRSRDGVALVLNAAHTFCSCFIEWIFLWPPSD